MELDCEVIISEVEKHPVLYNKNDESYQNRNSKIIAWQKVAEAVIGEIYVHCTEQEQSEIGKDIQKKWKTLKDAYIRSLKTQITKRRSGVNKRRPYIYQQQMAFLDPVIKYRPTTENKLAAKNVKREEVPEETEQLERAEEDFLPFKRSSAQKPQKETLETQLLKTFINNNSADNSISNNLSDDTEKMFLLSLLPKLKQLNTNAVLDFQIKTMQLLQQYLTDSKNLLNATPGTHDKL